MNRPPARFTGHDRPAPQRGALVLVLGLAILVAMTLGLVVSHRNLLVEQRMAAQQQRSAQAFAAAESGIDWAIAQLDSNRRLDDDCLSTPSASAASFRSRRLRIDPASGMVAPVPGSTSSGPTAPLAICARSAGGWTCRCGPAGSAPALSNADAAAAPAFGIRFAAAERPGAVRLIAVGCDRLAAPCDPARTRAAEATAMVEVTLALLPALPTPPWSVVTATGDVETDGAAVVLRSTDPAAGWLVDAGGRVEAAGASLAVPAGAPVDEALVDHDPGLVALEKDRFFARFFGARPEAWAARRSVARRVCPPGDCGDTIAAEAGAAADEALVWIDGDLEIAGPRSFGSPGHPVLLVVTGRARWRGAVTLHGVLQAGSFGWDDANAGSAIQGALLVAGDLRIAGAPTLARDAGALARLRRAGGFVPVPGSWHDF